MENEKSENDYIEEFIKNKMKSQFDPNSDAYKQRQEETRLAKDERDKKAEGYEKSARTNDFFDAISSSDNYLVGDNGGNSFADKSKDYRGRAAKLGEISETEDADRRKEEDRNLYNYLTERREQNRHNETIKAMGAKTAEEKRQFDISADIKKQQNEAQRLARATALATKRDKDIEERTVGGVGVARTKDDAKQLKEAAEIKDSFDRNIDALIKLREEYGGESLNREAVKEGKLLSTELLLQQKQLVKLGVLSASDMTLLNKLIPEDPLEHDMVPFQDPIMSGMKKFKTNSDADYQTRLKTRLKYKSNEKPIEEMSDEEILQELGGEEAVAGGVE